MPSSMRVLAIDPGYERCGVAILEKEGGREKLMFSDCIQTPSSAAFPERLVSVIDTIQSLVTSHAPQAIAIETLYFNTNQKTAMHVAEVRGALLYIAQKEGLHISEFTPAQIKSAITSWGKAGKKEVIAMVPKLVSIEKTISFDDEYDAIAIGLTYLAHSPQHS